MCIRDRLGNTSRGDNVAAFAEYEAFGTPSCGGGGGGGGGAPTPPNHGVAKTPDVADNVTLLSGVREQFSISVVNNRAEDLTNVSFVDTLPQGILYLGADVSAVNYEVATVTPALPGDAALEDFYVDTVTNPDGTSTVTWDGLPDLPTGTWTITFPVTGNSTIDEPETFQTNSFRLNTDLGPRNDVGSMFVSAIEEPTVTKRANRDQYGYDELITYTVDVTIPANYAGADLRVFDFINEPLGNNAYIGSGQIGRNGAELFSEAPVKFENYVSSECISGCGDPDDPDNTLGIEPVELSPLPLAQANDFDPDNILGADGSYSNVNSARASWDLPGRPRVQYYNRLNNAIGWYIGDIEAVPPAEPGEVREDRVLRFEFQVRTPSLDELVDAYVQTFDIGAIWTATRLTEPFTANLGRVETYWDRTKRNTVELRAATDTNALARAFWDDETNWRDNDVTDDNPNYGWFTDQHGYQFAARQVDVEDVDVQIQFPYVSIDKHCEGINGGDVEPLVAGQARNASVCSRSRTNLEPQRFTCR